MLRRTIRHVSAAALFAAALVSPSGPPAAARVVNKYQKVVTLYDFNATDLGYPAGGLIRDSAGNLYGTETGGAGGVFEFTPPPEGAPYKAWKRTTLYAFKGGSDGNDPWVPLLLDKSGNIYGVTRFGGGNGCFGQWGCGMVFEISPPAAGQTAWTETVLYRFTGGNDGAAPGGALVADAAGNLYGTTQQLGGAACIPACGRVFELSPPAPGHSAWNFQVLYASPAYDYPVGGVVFDAKGSLYGAEIHGAFSLSPPTPDHPGWTKTDIAAFGSFSGASSLIFDKQGNLYGVSNGQADPGRAYGAVYQLTPPSRGTRWAFKILIRFDGNDGLFPDTPVVLDAIGNLIGAAENGGGDHHGGVVYEVTPNQTEVILHKFSRGRSGMAPGGPLLFDDAGNAYDISNTSGTADKGAIWEILAQ